MKAKIALLAAAASLWAGAAAAQPHDMSQMKGMSMGLPPMPAIYAGQADQEGAPVFQGLGAHRFSITTSNPQSQAFFDQGVKLMFNFNHAEAIRSFREAARLDPECAMCWWGVAYALGPNINLPMPPDAVAPAWAALQRAQALAPKAGPRDQQWIAALATRYAAKKTDRAPLDKAFAEAMLKLWREHPDDLDAGVFAAEAMMDTQPWDYWQADGVTPKGYGAEVVKTLETVIARSPDHPGALHLYIHAVEASTTPERAERAADRLLALMPQAGHIVHMPSHIYYRVGRYADAEAANEKAALVDEQYIAACKAQGFYPAGYYGHNIHFLWTSSEMSGRYAASLDAARRLVKAVDAYEAAKQLPQAELYGFTPVATMVRFGKWKDLLAEPAPPKGLLLDNAIWLYGQAFAHANTRNPAAAAEDRKKLAALAKADFKRFDAAGVPARAMTQLALTLVDGEIARTSGDLTSAILQFQKASELERGLPYSEPNYWHQPVSHLLGAALMQANRPAEAEGVYRESLKTYRQDGWALYGLTQALQAQGKDVEARGPMNAFSEAWRRADTSLQASRL